MDKLKIAHIGTGNRGTGVYLPLIAKLKDDLELVAVCDVSEDSVEAQGAKYNVAAYTDTAEMLEKEKPDICSIVITPSNNHIPGLLCSEHGVSYCTETPIDTDLGWADEMIASAKHHGTKIEVNENYYRVPSERIKREMILAGVFGKINVAYNEFRGHGYHGVGLIRSYVGFDNEPLRVFGVAKELRSAGARLAARSADTRLRGLAARRHRICRWRGRDIPFQQFVLRFAASRF